MKAPKIIWPILLLVAGLTGWLMMPPPPQVRIRIEPDDGADVPVLTASTIPASCDPYFSHENNIPEILIPVSKPK